jgi:hypothetical protein
MVAVAAFDESDGAHMSQHQLPGVFGARYKWFVIGGPR